MGKSNVNREDFARQVDAMKHRYPNFTHKISDGKLSFTGDLVIKEELPIYNVTITYNGDRIPTVIVNSPAFETKPPHTYSDNSLCLFHRKYYNWTKDFLIAKNIVDWTATWAYFHEYWLQTGVWAGPEVPHSSIKQKDDD